ncbi:MAG TPA: KpsF/GutQ family sugar-phosphate isomerase [Candidatus Omnitrophota bacterium]|nr:KpsF/GutQ family sugar-phosphate isomerase [Candidatus Omnitrophota bacterium]
MKQDRALAKKVLRLEAEAVQALMRRIDRDFERALDLMQNCNGRIIVTGMGKPGFIARKIAATFASTGSPSFFVHPAEAIHGDLGMVTKPDLVLAISNSGETEEITRLLSTIKRIGARLIALTGNLQSTLAKNSDVALNVGFEKEACPWNLAPTASTTAALAMGDALAVCLAKRKGFREEDFAFLHPGGSLGKKLLKVKDLMRKGKANPTVLGSATVEKALLAITSARAGSCTIVDRDGKLKGIFTDGDLRRHLRENGVSILSKSIEPLATKRPITIQDEKLAAEALQLLRDKNIDELPVVDRKGRAVGLLDVQDLLKAGFV